jgi:threonine/homoserine/homoserine lactone efflux protein
MKERKVTSMTESTLALLIFLFPLAYSPGPGNMFFAANGARFGLAATLRANFGYHLATWLVTCAIGLGFLAAFERFPQVFYGLQIIGALYVLWLAASMVRMGALHSPSTARPAGFWSGFILLIVNPKAYLIITLMFSQFLIGAETGRLLAVVLIASVFTLNNMLAFVIWAAIGEGIARRFRAPNSARRLNLLFGAMLGMVAIWMLVR